MARRKPLPPIALKLVVGREPCDCAIAVLATYLGLPYEDVLRAAARAVRDYDGQRGLLVAEIQAVAKALGHPLRRRATVDTDEDYGIVEFSDHVAVLWHGLVYDPDGRLWEADDYCAHYDYQPWGLLYRRS
jgi:hypothetical protein